MPEDPAVRQHDLSSLVVMRRLTMRALCMGEQRTLKDKRSEASHQPGFGRHQAVAL